MIKILNPLVQIDHNTLGPLKITKYELWFLFVCFIWGPGPKLACPHGGSCRNSQVDSKDRKNYPFAKDGNLIDNK